MIFRCIQKFRFNEFIQKKSLPICYRILNKIEININENLMTI